MAFCSHGLKAAKDVLHKLDDKLEPIIDHVLEFTGTMMKGFAWPMVEGALKALPYGEIAAKALHTAIDEMAEAKEIIAEPVLSKKAAMFLDEVNKFTNYKKNGTLVKVASIMVAIIHDLEHNESTYDTLTQVKALTVSAEAKKAA